MECCLVGEYRLEATITASLYLRLLSTETFEATFSPSYLEEITRKAGRFMRYDVFTELLIRSMRQGTLSVLTPEDLNMMKPKTRDMNKRYLILDGGVYYPLPMVRVEKGDMQQAEKELYQLRYEREQLRQHEQHLMMELDQLRQEYGRREMALIKENLRLKQEIDAWKDDRERVYRELRQETRAEFESIQKEMKLISKTLKPSMEEQMNRCYALIEQLLDELQRERDRAMALVKEKDEEIQRIRASEMADTRERRARHRSHTPSQSHTTRHRSLTPIQSQMTRRVSTPPPQKTRASAARSPSPATFKRFDPTAYVQEKKQKQEEARRRSLSRQRSLSRSSSVESRGRAADKENTRHQKHVPKPLSRQPHKKLNVDEIDERLNILQKYFANLRS